MIQSLERAFSIMELVAEDPERPKFLSEIAAKAGLKPGTCANLLQTMVELQYLEQVAARKGYLLGPKAFRLTRHGPYRKELRRAAESAMVALAARVRETVLLVVLVNGVRNILIQINGDEVFQIRERYLQEDNLYATPTGRLLLAHLSDGELASVLARRGVPAMAQWPEAAGKGALRTALERIRKAGHTLTQGDLVGVAFPVRRKDKVVAALGLFLPKFCFNGEHKKDILAGMANTAAKISAQLSGGHS